MQQQWWRIGGERLRKAAEYYRKYHTIQAIPREVSGPRMTAGDRAQGRIPAVVFSPTAANTSKQLLTTETKQIDAILTKLDPTFFCSTTLKLQVRAGSGSSVVLHSGNVLPIKLARNEETGKVMNVEFVWAEEGSKLEVDVPVVFKGVDSCPGLKKGGQLSTLRKNLKYLCPTECIPQKIEVDISNLDIGDGIFMKDIEVDPSLKPLSGNDTKPICKIVASEVENLAKKFGSDAEHNRMKRNFYHSVTLSKKRRTRRIKRLQLSTHYLEVNYRTLKAVVFYGPNIDHLPFPKRLKDPNLLVRSGMPGACITF